MTEQRTINDLQEQLDEAEAELKAADVSIETLLAKVSELLTKLAMAEAKCHSLAENGWGESPEGNEWIYRTGLG